MQRFTISLEAGLASEFDAFIDQHGYGNRSEAVRDLIRQKMGQKQIELRHAAWCAATVSYVFQHDDHTVARRLLQLQHDHHDLVVSSTHIHLDHHHCLQTVVLRGPTTAVSAFADQLVALRGVHHGGTYLLPLKQAAGQHRHEDAGRAHSHLTPAS